MIADYQIHAWNQKKETQAVFVEMALRSSIS